MNLKDILDFPKCQMTQQQAVKKNIHLINTGGLFAQPDGIPVINYKNSTDQILAIFWFEKLENIYVVFFIQP